MIEPVIRPLVSDDEARECATIMSTSEPWITLRRDFQASFEVVRDPAAETYVAIDDSQVIGFVVISMQGAFRGYIRSIATRNDRRGQGVGGALIAFAEARIFRDSPNVFICVSDFNVRARALYARLGYETVGELHDFIVGGQSEWLLRKTIGPIVRIE